MQIPKDLCEDMAFVKRLEELVKDFTEYELVMRDEVARKNALRRDKSDQQTRDVDSEREGSEMSYQGKKVEDHGIARRSRQTCDSNGEDHEEWHRDACEGV